MMKKSIYLLTIPLTILILLLLGITLSSYLNKEGENTDQINQETPECLNEQATSLPQDLTEVFKNTCITKYDHTNEEITAQAKLTYLTYPEILYSIRKTDWGSTDITENDTQVIFTNGNQSLTLSNVNNEIYMSLKTVQSDSKVDDTPVPKPVQQEEEEEPTSSNEYKVTSTEISKINTTQKIVVFTFDGGAGIQSLEKIITVLDDHDIKATFFVTGKWAETQSSALKKISDAGHEVFNHTYSHPDLTKLTSAQITEEFSKAESKISAVTGKTTKPFYRPPYGARNSSVRELAASLGYQTIYWTIDALDWKESEGITETEVRNRILNNLAPGNIYLMHIGDNITGNILDDVLTQIESKGYQVRSLSEVLIK